MAEATVLNPDLGFIKDLQALGGGDLKKCYQCATCSVVCPISPETKPYPRKEMIAASWGLKDKVVHSADIWLCHNCGDCNTRCPRGAKPGDALGAIRAYAISEYAGIKALGRMVRDKSKLPILLLIPFVILLAGGLISNLVGLNWMTFSPEGGHEIWQSSYYNNYLVDIIMIPTFFFAVITFALGLKRFIGDIHANALAEGKTTQEKIDPAGFVQALIKVVPTIFKHNKFTECTENRERSTSHMMVLFSFIGLFIVTNCFFIAEWILHIEGPYSQLNPVKWLGNIAGIALIIGALLLMKSRMAKTDSNSSYWDWYLVSLVLALGVTGMLTQLLRLGGLYDLMAIVYWLHLIAIWSLFAYTPFSKLAHLVYRTTAMAYAEYSNRGF
ncbi:MAG: quinone-interacting membrane-bound oxidoreductase complex subunit QmoC [Desulfobacterales bacterium]|nr:quinone-interacting membrane-bound oxidoreductase complex subunit QmoC [Desulfobacterales bacterium]